MGLDASCLVVTALLTMRSSVHAVPGAGCLSTSKQRGVSLSLARASQSMPEFVSRCLHLLSILRSQHLHDTNAWLLTSIVCLLQSVACSARTVWKTVRTWLFLCISCHPHAHVFLSACAGAYLLALHVCCWQQCMRCVCCTARCCTASAAQLAGQTMRLSCAGVFSCCSSTAVCRFSGLLHVRCCLHQRGADVVCSYTFLLYFTACLRVVVNAAGC